MTFSDIDMDLPPMLAAIRNAYLTVYPDSQLKQVPIERFEIIRDDVWFYSKEYNGACHCHPEMERHEFSLPINLADDLIEDDIVAFLSEQKRVAEESAEKERLEREKRLAQEKHERELKLFNELKEKFAENNG